MDLDELKLQIALGTISDEIREIVWSSTDKETLRILGGCTDVLIRKAVAINIHIPYSTIKQLMYDSDWVVRWSAWQRISDRYKRRFGYTPVSPIFLEHKGVYLGDLPPGVLINKQ